MYLPSPQPIGDYRSACVGDVKIHPSAMIAPGVLLCADPDSQILISAGVCIGLGSILRACAGKLEILEGANLGTGVLLIGKGKIGKHACVGSASTILNSDVAPGQVVAPGSLIGDTSRQVAGFAAIAPDSPANPNGAANDAIAPAGDPQPTADLNGSEALVNSSLSAQPTNPVYGQGYVHQMMGKMFPKANLTNDPWGN
ncbi:MAG: transferase [Aphanocapsa sp. GSE-SYN-MK-11-07L]|jgi:carbon dioxide concentrating mechanism protein CcmN|nr:transferase [Aphanocapsa sp. GSE-SYN-MK-11-07L]